MFPMLKTLQDLGVIEKATVVTNTVASLADFHSSLSTGDPASNSGQLDQAFSTTPKSQPSLFRKALAFALCDQLSTATNLSEVGRTLFLAEPNQAGVPAGRAYPAEVTNYQTFLKADKIQVVDNIAYSLDGDSYFEYLTIYLRSITKNSDPAELSQVRAQLLKARQDKEQAYDRARSAYLGSHPTPSSKDISFIDALNADAGYITAWSVETALEDKYTKLQSDALSGLSSQLDQIKSADDRLVERVNNNMPCIALSDDYIHNPRFDSDGKLVVDPKNIYYRPFHNLPDFTTLCNDWQSLNTDAGTTSHYGPISISLLDARDRKWSELGHTGLDDAATQTLTDVQVKLLGKLRISLTFVGKPAVLDVDRGFWDVGNIRNKNWGVANTLPAALKRNFCKTVKMMFAWSIEITIKLLPGDEVPPVTDQANGTSAHTATTVDIEDFNLAFLKLGLVPILAQLV